MELTDWFEDVTTETGVLAKFQSGRSAQRNTILETVGGGVGLIDVDLDGRLDLYSVGGGTIDPSTGTLQGAPGQLFRQQTNGRFYETTSLARLTASPHYSQGILAADFDNDGFPDLLLTCHGSLQLWHNLGDGTFAERSQSADLAIPGWHTAAACVDANSDGLVDLFVADYLNWPTPGSDQTNVPIPKDVPPPQEFPPAADHLFLNSGDGRFEEVSRQAGIRTDGMGLGVVAADLNSDGSADLYAANDVVANHLYWGSRTLPLQESGEPSGTAYNEAGTPEGSMGVDAEDVNGDGRPDLWVTNFELEDNSLYLNLGDGQFQHASARFGLAGQGRSLVGFGTGFQDFDNDGWPDLYVLNGHVQYHSPRSPFQQPAALLRNLQGQRFEDVTPQVGPWFRTTHTARGGAAGDWNNDGAIDLVVSSLDEPLTILRNRKSVPAALRLRLVGVQSPRDAVGATVTAHLPQRSLTRLVKSGSGFLSQSDPRIQLPLLAESRYTKITVRWPTNQHERFPVPDSPGDHVLIEGHGTALD